MEGELRWGEGRILLRIDGRLGEWMERMVEVKNNYLPSEEMVVNGIDLKVKNVTGDMLELT